LTNVRSHSNGLFVLSGGVGGAKLVLGLSKVLKSTEFLVVVNTGDDFHHLGLKICPDIDTVTYTLADLVDQERGWGLKDETWNFLNSLKGLGGDGWFNLGDKDLATHVERTQRLARGDTLTSVTKAFASSLGVSSMIVPMTNDPVSTIVETSEEHLAFQHYFVRDRCLPEVKGFHFYGIGAAKSNPLISEYCEGNNNAAIVLAPSNPFVSIDPILGVPGLKDRLLSVKGPKIAISPIINGGAVKGPAAKMMEELGIPSTAMAIANHYKGFIDALVIDHSDSKLFEEIEDTGIKVFITNTVMRTLENKVVLANECLNYIDQYWEDKW
jgi:LPPG:FO 2-phospho-L-lactate transferase